MKPLTEKELHTLSEAESTCDGNGYDFSRGYRLAETKHLATIKKLQRILKSHRVVLEVMYAPKPKK